MAVVAAVLVVGATAVPAIPAVATASGPGIGSRAALAGPDCDPDTERVRMVYAYVPPCVVPFAAGADNGGATTRGVTADAIRVVVYTGIPAHEAPEDATVRGKGLLAVNFATGQPGTIEDAVHDVNAALGHVLESWGRELVFEYVTRSGTDEAAQRADAVAVVARKPFAVLDMASAEVFCSEVASRKVIAICATGTNAAMEAQQPYRYGTFIDYWANVISVAQLVGGGLAGKPAKWAGDSQLQQTRRTFGVVYQDSQTGIDVDLWERSLRRYRAPAFAAELSYDPGTEDVLGNPAVSQEQAPTMIGRLADAGVTTVVLFTDITMTQALTRAATDQDYHPEWLSTGFAFQEYPGVARLFDQDQWAHAFGVGSALAPIAGGRPLGEVMPWYWGTDNYTFDAGVLGELVVLTFGVHLAGPTLTPASFRRAVFAVGAQGGAVADDPSRVMLARGRGHGFPYTQYLFGGDVQLGWWNPDATIAPDPGQAARPGAWMFLDRGERHLQGRLREGEPAFFDHARSVAELPRDEWPLRDYPCAGCPSSGSGTQPGA
jgi:hypothetical protein